MTDPKEKEEINEELSIDELKSVSGGIVIRGNGTMLKGNNLAEICDVGTSLRNPQGSGSGMTRRDYDKSVGIIDPGHKVGFDINIAR
ncbi:MULTISPECIES: CCRG-2 family RiPP [Prochlorococcus]|uniref:CCRG-2 family RiPP n=1 Tax=Prochlorococcus TaxID=1218 RepID=UPI0007B371B8|nr:MULTISPECIES: CCRG-2 family RiPP [Prochlorococcus]KZR65310.1 hypothetical protein PMIT1312_01201 [Prochlorococcus marinus str. MIT 1312]KZR79189.1 hypothetical protein PMIT1327_02396 [Prochlorococcus marinus str. MIT 1327]NMO83984.1 CCRG-2 family RiPP [Prochlorococcus sp. P1344]NMP06963.1 CCRG-2 family RiPP [Prochlorococcus sp. P1361]NMP12806.1 CCRG-2 family RiPP [Prochlorococcus sp.P1363]